jgi:mannose-6-phosphate isomerase-like protein (cupin superfamily)
VTIGESTAVLAGKGIAYAPPGTLQEVANRSDRPAEVYVWHSPAGADHAFAEAHRLCRGTEPSARQAFAGILERHDFQFEAPAPGAAHATNAPSGRIDAAIERFEDFARLRVQWSTLAPTPRLVDAPGQARNVQVGGQETRVLVTPEESGAHASVFMGVLRDDFAAPLHHQCSEDETFIVVEGPVNLRIGNAVANGVAQGGFAYAPRFATHGFSSKAGAPATLYSMNSPGGHDRGFELGSTAADAPNFLELIDAHGFTFHPG